MNAIIATDNLTKRFGATYVVKDINLVVHEGEIYGFLGPNGAGKTTTLKMLLGLIRPTSGSVHIFGKNLVSNERWILSQTGSLIESPSHYEHLTGLENLRIIQKLRDVPEGNITEVLKIVRLEKHKDKKVREYSLGMKQRLGLAMALLSFPKLLILDEPTNGLDPAGIGEIRELIKALPAQYGMTVLLSSHLLSEIEQIATTVGIIHHGRLLYQGSMNELKKQQQPTILMKTRDNPLAKRILATKGWTSQLQGDYLVFDNMTDEEVALANKLLINANIDVLRIEEKKKTLESIFLELTGEERDERDRDSA